MLEAALPAERRLSKAPKPKTAAWRPPLLGRESNYKCEIQNFRLSSPSDSLFT